MNGLQLRAVLKIYRDQLSKLSQGTEGLEPFEAFLAKREDKKIAALAKEIVSARSKRAKA